MADNKDLLASIEKGAALKHAETKDASAPKIDEGMQPFPSLLMLWSLFFFLHIVSLLVM